MQFQSNNPPKGVEIKDWQSPLWQQQRALRKVEHFEEYFNLSSEERAGFELGKQKFKVLCTPYYARLAANDQTGAIRKILIPSSKEFSTGGQQMLDPLAENVHRPAERIIHRYPDRALFLVTDHCSVYCRYCTRKHFTGQNQVFPKGDEYAEALDYLRRSPQIKEVILSGGDPLTLSDDKLEQVIKDLRTIPSVELLRIGSRIPVVNPFRITPNLIEVFRRGKPVFFMTHFNHPDELTTDSAQALEALVDGGIPVFNQMVLLNGVNNHEDLVYALSRRLLYLRVKPYYMFQCDPSEGTEYLRTSIEDSEEIQRALWGKASGLAMPNLSIDIPGGGGKVGLTPNYEVDRDVDSRTFRGWDGVEQSYEKPLHKVEKPVVPERYQSFV